MKTNQPKYVALALVLAVQGILLLATCSKDSPGVIEYTPTLPNEIPMQGPQYTTVVEDFSILNSAGQRIYGQILRPDPGKYDKQRFAAVVKVPGGINPGRMEVNATEAIALSGAGMVVVCFNAEGRVDARSSTDLLSEGMEDHNGFKNQNTLADVITYVMNLPYVIKENIGLRTQSYGITMGAGCVARYPELPVKYIVDGEGPSESFVTVQEPWALFSPEEHPNHNKYQIAYGIFGHYSTYRDSSAENLTFWEEREALRFIGSFNGMYLRLQAEWDHSQPPGRASEIQMFHQPPIWWQCKHTCDMVNAAVDGGVPWVRVNLAKEGNGVNSKYHAGKLPRFVPGELNNLPLYSAEAVLEMALADAVNN
jgi:hypothetical protein